MSANEWDQYLHRISSSFEQTDNDVLVKEFMELVEFNPNCMTAKEFQEMYLGSWEVDQRIVELENRIYKFYNDNQNCCNKVYIVKWKDLRKELAWLGYSADEILNAKKVIKNWRLNDES